MQGFTPGIDRAESAVQPTRQVRAAEDNPVMKPVVSDGARMQVV